MRPAARKAKGAVQKGGDGEETTPPEPRRTGGYSHWDPFVSALVAKLPAGGTVWSQAERDAFIAVFHAIAPIVWKET
jgi:hypothetical protein